MNKFWSILLLVVAVNANAQNAEVKACYEKVKAEQEAIGLQNLSQLKRLGGTVGNAMEYFPVCADVVAAQTDVKNRIYQAYQKECLNPEIIADMQNSNYRIKQEFDNDVYASRLKTGTEGELAQVVVQTIPYQSISCFSEDTKITVYNATTSTFQNQTFKDFSDYWDDNQHADTFEKIYVLSSPVEMLPDASKEYQGACWGEVSAYTYANLYNDGVTEVCTVKYTDGQTEGSCVATPDHRFRVEIGEVSGNKTYEWKHLKDIKPETMKLISDRNTPVKIESIAKSKVEDWDKGGFWGFFDLNWVTDMRVYNLKVNTGTYYVGDNQNRILVHNMY